MLKDKITYQTLDLSCNAEQALQIVLDVNHYHEFIPLVKMVEITQHHQDGLGFDSLITTGIYNNISRQLTSTTRFNKEDGKSYRVHTRAVSTKQDIELESIWNITAKGNNSCDVEHQLGFLFTNPIWHKIAKVTFKSAAKIVEKAFLRRLMEKYHL